MIRRLMQGAGEIAFALGLVLAVGGFWFAFTLFPCGLCLFVAATGLTVRLLARPFRRRWLGVAIAVGLGAIAVGVVGTEAVLHLCRDDVRFESRCEGGRLADAVFGVVPEGDLASLGVKGSRLFNAWPAEQMDEIHPLLRKEYDAMRRDPAFAHVGNAAAAGYMSESGHRFFRYLPRGYSIKRKWPLLVFLHGGGGNLALSSWLWSPFADARGFVILCPTWGNGRWETREGTQAALDALDDTVRSCAIDEERVLLAGYSNGAIGGWAVLKTRPQAFCGFVSLSGVKGPGWDSPSVRDVPVLLLHGSEDAAIPIGESRRLCESLQRAERNVELVEFPGDDHFLLLRSSPRVHETVWTWMQALEQ